MFLLQMCSYVTNLICLFFLEVNVLKRSFRFKNKKIKQNWDVGFLQNRKKNKSWISNNKKMFWIRMIIIVGVSNRGEGT